MNFSQPNSALKKAGMNSGSTILNITGILLIVIFALLVHLILEVIKFILKRCCSNEAVLRLFRKIHFFFTFNAYLMVLLLSLTFISIGL